MVQTGAFTATSALAATTSAGVAISPVDPRGACEPACDAFPLGEHSPSCSQWFDSDPAILTPTSPL